MPRGQENVLLPDGRTFDILDWADRPETRARVGCTRVEYIHEWDLTWTCKRCGTEQTQEAGVTLRGDVGTEINGEAVPLCNHCEQHSTMVPYSAVIPAEGVQPPVPTSPPPALPATPDGRTLPLPPTELTDLPAAIAYAAAIDAHYTTLVATVSDLLPTPADLAASLELARTNLSTAGVTGSTFDAATAIQADLAAALTSLRAALANVEAAAAAARSLQERLGDQWRIREEYDAQPDAGRDDFINAGT